MENKKVSIIMPVYNAHVYLEETINSILSQTYKNFELIVIDDSSTDESKDLALSWADKDKRIIVIDNKYKKGIHGASNSGLDIASGEFIAKADADDIQRPYRLEVQIKFLEKNKNIDIVGGGYELFGNGKDGIKIFHPTGSLHLAWKFITNLYFCNPTVTFRRCVLNTVPHYPEVACEDFAFLSKAIKSHRGYNVNKILIDYRQHNSNYSNTAKENIEKSVQNIFKENYEFYTGTLKNSEIFFDFHSKQNLKLKNLLKITKVSYKISQKILDEYHVPKISLKAFYLYSIIKINILKSLFLPYLRAVYRKIKN